MAVEYIDRPPRIQPELPTGEIPIPNPPTEEKGNDQALLSVLVPIITIIGFVFVSGGGNVLFIIPMGLGMILSVGVSLFSARQQEQVFIAKKKAYQELLAQMRQDMNRSHNTQRLFYQHNYPDTATVLDIAARTERSRFGSRLWERRSSDNDFGALRLGVGSRPSTVVYKTSQTGSGPDDDPLMKDAQQLALDSQLVSGAPITVPLRNVAEKRQESEGGGKAAGGIAVPARHSMGIFGKNPTNISDFARAVLVHFTAFHSALDTRLYVVGLPDARANWQWAEWLPHCTVRGVGDEEDTPGQAIEFDQLCFSNEKPKVSEFWKRIKRELDSRQVRMRDTNDSSGGKMDVSLPFVLVVVDLLGDIPPNSPLKDVAAEAVVATINQSGPQLGAAIIFLSKDPARIPSECVAMVEVAAVGGKVNFRYTEVGLNTPRHIGEADVINAADARQKFAAQIRRLDLRRSFGADLPRSVNLLEMEALLESRKIDTVDKLSVKENWEFSMRPENSEWLSVPIGLVSLREVRSLVFSAKEGGDGVHGMIAGTTGSGKSELLLTLIAGLAAKYDPRIVNFVLVDFKGGAAFEPFKKLPHCVDILTNLQANAVSRMFVAIQAVMEQRAGILARSNAKDLVDYRKKIIPRLKPDDPLPHTFPHLFIIVDEFAEMIVQNPEYKAQFESVTRLGRAFGVSLLLATQRPAGVVTDQMRSNMKFRVCLRVETPEDSKELLSRPDAAFLPNMGGRGYIQVGNDILTAVQVARAGGDYSDDRLDTLKDIIWLDEESMPRASANGNQPLYSGPEIAEALGLKPGEKAATLVDWVVGITALRAKRDGIPVQTKPWPNPLPAHLTLTEHVDAQYLNTERDLGADKSIIINPAIQAWLQNTDEKALWEPVDWKNPSPLRVDIGLIDNPYRAEQRLLTIDLSADPLVLFGASGRGKTTFVKTLLLALAARRSPNELHMFAFDFGRGGLKTIKDMPHLGAAVDASEVARVDQLMRMLRNIVNERQERLAKYNSLADFNAKNPNQPFAEVVVIIDNFAEFKESFEHQIPELMALIRDGRAFGMYFVITASTTGDLTAKLYNLLTQRLALTMAESMQYLDIVGSGWRPFDNVPGRGLIAIAAKDKPLPVEFQIGTPGRVGQVADADQPDPYQMIGRQMEKIWLGLGGKRPAAELPRSVTFLEMFSLVDARKEEFIGDLGLAEKWKHSMLPENQDWLKAPLGLISSKEVRTLIFSAKANGDGVHGMIAGTTGSGKSELLLSMIAAMAVEYDPRIVNFVLVDFKGGAAFEPFKKLPHCVDIATNLMGNAVERIFIAIKAEMDRRAKLLADGRVGDLVDYRKRVIPKLRPDDPLPHTFPHLFVIVDEFAEMIAQNPEYKAQFESITRLGRAFGVTLILATQRPAGAVTDQMRSNMKFRICLRVETPEDSKELLKRPDAARLPPIGGRGYIQVGNDLLTEIQVAWAGAEWGDAKPDPVYSTEEILEAMHLKPENKPGLQIDWIVGAAAAEARRQGVPKQHKPWPDPLPETLPLNQPIDATYLEGGHLGPEVTLSQPLTDWIANTEEKSLWQPFDWQSRLPLHASLGVVDDPFHSMQRVLNIDVAADPMVVFGSSGRGKSTFLKAVLLSLAAARSPRELNIFGLDFGRGGLKALKPLPHVGAMIDVSQPERVEQLFRMVRGIMAERQERLAKFASMEDYNAANLNNPDLIFPAVVIVIDNFAEFRENYEPLMPDLIGMVRDGRSFGIYYLITANQVNDLTGKLYNVMTQRLTFTLPDHSAYVDIVGRGALSLANLPGRGLVNIDGQPLEFQVGVPVMEHEKDPFARLAERMERVWAAQGGKKPAAEIPRGVGFLELFSLVDSRKIESFGDLNIAQKWHDSMLPENQEWLKAPLGLISSKEVRTLIFSAKANGDGVHGMIAGTTGSGKSELLLSMIAGMAVKYDPRIVNFVLVDFKGGAAFEPFKKLPHCVDIATNLMGNAVERIFIAIKAEMDRRAKLLADGRVGDLVDYRKRVIPKLRPGDPLPNTFPHLFVIVDEFAEMITQNPEYKAQFESITRLGRAFGVTLILATQRPAGAVTDQMRSNMKFRICLRVETADDSKELLKRPDAATLPAIGGRGYVQVGGGSLTEIQVAWAGAEWSDAKPDSVYTTDEILEAMNLRPENKPGLLIDWIVGATAAEARRQGIPKQYKPWPNPLPEVLPLNQPIDATYIDGGHGGPEIVLNPPIAKWMENTTNQPLWPAADWQTALTIKSAMGLVDNPYLAQQRVLTIDLSADPLVIFGSAGRGKSTFLKSLLTSLAAAHSPNELHMYALDFARGGLKALRSLPHMAGIVDVNEEERVERLLRMVRNTIEERQTKIQAYDSLTDYNLKNPAIAFPAVVVVIDNVSEFKETYDRYLGELMALIRDGRSFGVYFVITASLTADVPNKLFSLLSQRVTFTLPDPTEYTTVVGRGWARFNDVPGRGLAVQLVGDRPVPLEFQTAVPVAAVAEAGAEGAPAGDAFRELTERMAAAWQTLETANPALKSRRPKRVEPLPKLVPLQTVLPALGKGDPNLAVPVGLNDLDREPMRVDFLAKGPHWIVIGPPVTGKSTALRSLVLSLAHGYTPEQVALVLVDPSDTVRRFHNFGGSGDNTLAKLPHVLATVSTAKELDEVIKRLTAEYDEQVVARLTGQTEVYVPQDNQKRRIFVIIDHYDDVEPLNKGLGLAGLAQVGKGRNMHLVIGGTLGIMRSGGDELRRRAESARYSLVLQDYETVRYMGAKGNFSITKELPPGRGFLVKAVSASLVQIGMADVDGVDGRTAEEQLDGLIGAIRARYQPAKWSYFAGDLTTLDKAIHGEEAPPAAGGPPPESPSTTDAMASIAELMKMQASMTGSLGTIAEVNPLNFASVEIQETPAAEGANGTNGAEGGNGAHAASNGDGAPAPEPAKA